MYAHLAGMAAGAVPEDEIVDRLQAAAAAYDGKIAEYNKAGVRRTIHQVVPTAANYAAKLFGVPIPGTGWIARRALARFDPLPPHPAAIEEPAPRSRWLGVCRPGSTLMTPHSPPLRCAPPHTGSPHRPIPTSNVTPLRRRSRPLPLQMLHVEEARYGLRSRGRPVHRHIEIPITKRREHTEERPRRRRGVACIRSCFRPTPLVPDR